MSICRTGGSYDLPAASNGYQLEGEPDGNGGSRAANPHGPQLTHCVKFEKTAPSCHTSSLGIGRDKGVSSQGCIAKARRSCVDTLGPR